MKKNKKFLKFINFIPIHRVLNRKYQGLRYNLDDFPIFRRDYKKYDTEQRWQSKKETIK